MKGILEMKYAGREILLKPEIRMTLMKHLPHYAFGLLSHAPQDRRYARVGGRLQQRLPTYDIVP